MKAPAAGPDFASAAMMRLVAAGLSRQNLAVPFRSPDGAHVPRTLKHDVVTAVLAAHGPLAVLRIAEAARVMSPEPVVQALVHARDIVDLIDRWHRLERFSHGRHRVDAQIMGDGSLVLTHLARDGGPPPSPGESLLVFGLIAILAEMIGSVAVSLATVTGDVWRRNGAWVEPELTRPVGPVILASSGGPAPERAGQPDLSGDPVARLRDDLVADPLRRWTVSDLAARAGMSRRSLQRCLTDRALTFSRLVSEARLQVAAAHLRTPGGPGLAEIGFLAGYSDQAHFTRSFARSVGTTPRTYKENFGARPVPDSRG